MNPQVVSARLATLIPRLHCIAAWSEDEYVGDLAVDVAHIIADIKIGLDREAKQVVVR